MNIVIQLLNRLGDEIGDFDLETVRLADVGSETAVLDLADQMLQLDARLGLALARTGYVSILDALGTRIAVSRALLNPMQNGVVIPLQVRPLNEPAAQDKPTAGWASRKKTPDLGLAADTGNSGWDELFALDTETGIRQSASGTALLEGKGGRVPTGSKDGNDSNRMAIWEALGETRQMDDLEETDEGG